MKRKKKFAASLFTKPGNMEPLPINEELARQNPGAVDHVPYTSKGRVKLEAYLRVPIVASPPANTPEN